MTSTLSIEMGNAMQAVQNPEVTISQLEKLSDTLFYDEAKKVVLDAIEKALNNAGGGQANLL